MDEKPIAAGKSSFAVVDSETVMRELDLDTGPVLLDIASGAGNYALIAASRIAAGGRVYAFDLWKEGIEELRRRIDQEGLANIEAAVADVTARIPLEDDSADVCLVATALHDLIEEKGGEGALAEMARVLKPGGRLVIVEFIKADGPPGPPRHIRLSPEELDEFVTPFGFEKDHTIEAGPHTYLSRYTLR